MIHKTQTCTFWGLWSSFSKSYCTPRAKRWETHPNRRFTVNDACSSSGGRGYEDRSHFSTNKGKNITTSAVNEETSEPKSIFQCDKALTHTRKKLVSKTTKTNSFHPGRRGNVPRQRTRGESGELPPAGKGRRSLPAEPSPRPAPGTAPQLRQRLRRQDHCRRPRDRPGPEQRLRRPGSGASFPPGPSSLLSHRRSPPREGDGAARGGPRRSPSAPPSPERRQEAAGRRRSPARRRGEREAPHGRGLGAGCSPSGRSSPGCH